MPVKIKLPEPLTCQRCRWVWVPRKVEVRICPHCKSAYWDVKKETGDVTGKGN